MQDPDDGRSTATCRATRSPPAWSIWCCRSPRCRRASASSIEQLRADGRSLSSPPGAATAADAMREILTLLRIRTGHDFANYKPGTVHRRVARRMHLRHLPDLQSYARLPAREPRRSRDADEGTAHQRHQLLPRPGWRSTRSTTNGAAAASSTDKGAKRPGARLGAGVRHRRGSLFDRHAAGRAREAARRAAGSPGVRHRSRRAGDRGGARRPSTRTRTSPTCPRSGCSGSSCGRPAATGCGASCARWCCSRRTTSSAIRRSRTSI